MKRVLKTVSFLLLLAAGLNASAQMQWVDLGLSVKWASCNLGASTPDGYGEYYAWGETSPSEEYTEEESRTYGKSLEDLKRAGIVDAKGNLTAKYDVARRLGKGRMPTLAEVRELKEKCTWRWIPGPYNSEGGVRVTGPNGKSIFIPAVGGVVYLRGISVGSGGYFWSSTAEVGKSHGLYFDNKGPSLHSLDRYYGYPIRPVMDK